MKPNLIIVRGPPGSGKSTISKLVGEKLNKKTIVFNKDSFLNGIKFLKVDPDESRRELVNSIINIYLDKGHNVIIDGIYGGNDGAKKLDKLGLLAKSNNANFYVINLHCSLKTSFRRVVSRKGHIVPGKFPKKEIKKWHEFFYQTDYKKGIEVYTEKMSLKKTLNFIIKNINEDK